MVDVGSGHTVVMAHGMELDHRLFEPQIAGLKGQFRTVAYDLRGRSALGEQPYNLYDLVDDFVELLDYLEVGRCVLVGMSMGGFMGLRAALLHPARVAGLVIIGSSGIPYAQKETRRWAAVYEALRNEPRLSAERARADAELHFSLHTRQRRPELVNVWAERIGTHSGRATYHEFQSWAKQDDLRSRLSEITVPTLMIHGDEDAALPLSMALETHGLLPTSRLLVLPYAGHAVNLEFDRVVNTTIATFAEQVFDRG